MLKQIKWGSVLLSVVYIVTGGLLCAFPNVSGNIICRILGIVAGIYGVVNLTTYFLLEVKDSLFRNEFVIGVMSLIGALLIVIQQTPVLGIVPIILGMVIITSGFVKMQRALVAFRIGYDKSSWYFVLGIVSVILGLVIIFFLNGSQAQKIVFTTIGAGLIYSGVSDLFITFFLANKLHQYIKEFAVTGKKPEEEKTGEEEVSDDAGFTGISEPELIDPEIMEPQAVMTPIEADGPDEEELPQTTQMPVLQPEDAEEEKEEQL
ncbi:MAG: DUF308 domain-containing protein [Solobacterium sp.]|nr:DUF308 domain-containing protein [Solobacterium sp.]